MYEKDIKNEIERYEERLEKYGVNIKTLGWQSEEQQNLRFKILSEVANLQDTEILDVGCGFGDFYKYLLNNNIGINYTGYDISTKLIAEAKKKYL